MRFHLFDASGFKLAQTFTFPYAKRQADEIADRTGAAIVVGVKCRQATLFAPPGFKCVYARNVAAMPFGPSA